jgi:hypothetical protein
MRRRILWTIALLVVPWVVVTAAIEWHASGQRADARVRRYLGLAADADISTALLRRLRPGTSAEAVRALLRDSGLEGDPFVHVTEGGQFISCSVGFDPAVFEFNPVKERIQLVFRFDQHGGLTDISVHNEFIGP